jgi:hypothetical protein
LNLRVSRLKPNNGSSQNTKLPHLVTPRIDKQTLAVPIHEIEYWALRAARQVA